MGNNGLGEDSGLPPSTPTPSLGAGDAAGADQGNALLLDASGGLGWTADQRNHPRLHRAGALSS